MYGIYFMAYNRVAHHVLVQSAHHSHCISFYTNFGRGVPFSISISSLLPSYCDGKCVIYELQTADIAEHYLISHLYPLCICLLYLKVIVDIYYFVILDKVSNKSIVPWVCNTYGRNVHFNNALYWNGCPNQCHMPLSYSIFGVIGHVTHVFCCANSMSHGGHESLD